MEKQYIGFIYVWHNTLHNIMYIGSHLGKEDDGYVGSGVYFRRAYKKYFAYFTRYILEYHYSDAYSLLLREEHYLKKYNVLESTNFYNLTDRAGGGYNCAHLTEEELICMKAKILKGRRQRDLARTKEEWAVIKSKKQQSWAISSKLQTHSENTSKRRMLEEQNKTDEDRELFSEKCRQAYYSRPIEQLKESYMKRSTSVSKWHKNMSEEDKKNRSEAIRKNKKEQKGRQIRKDGVGKCVPENELQNWLDNGWELGMLPKKKKGPCRWVNKNGKQMFIQESKLEQYLNDGWVFGMFSRKPIHSITNE